ncbi:MAG: 16S rRNA (guanine(527)-N(7))-methyltransferase RsmG [candidate division WOR-3 bacterium]
MNNNIDYYKILKDWCQTLGLKITDEEINKFRAYAQLICNWNTKINLISRKDVDRIVSYHFIDSVSSVGLISYGAQVADLGSGAGLPGIPVKIVRPDINLTLIESIKKKARFLEETIKLLNLSNTQVLAARAEMISNGLFDTMLVRLVGKIKDILKIVSPLLKVKGLVIFYKSQQVNSEIKAAQRVALKKHFVLSQVNEVILPCTHIIREFVVYTKVSD